MSHKCNNCFKEGINGATLFSCAQCESVVYCSKKCQKERWADHKKLCEAIRNFVRPLVFWRCRETETSKYWNFCQSH